MKTFAKSLIAVVIAFSLTLGFVGASPVSAAMRKPVAVYPLGKAKTCRPDYVKRTRRHRVGNHRNVRYVACVYHVVKTKVTAPKGSHVHYLTSVDPSFTQDPQNPLDVTFSYSAGATAMATAGTATNLATTGQLPDGILELYSDGLLKCAMAVGAGVTGGTCNVLYQAEGSHSVTVEYLPNGANPVTQTDNVLITIPSVSATPIDTVTKVTGNWTAGDTETWTGTLSISATPTNAVGLVQFLVKAKEGDLGSQTPWALNTVTTGQTECDFKLTGPAASNPLYGDSPYPGGSWVMTSDNCSPSYESQSLSLNAPFSFDIATVLIPTAGYEIAATMPVVILQSN